MRLKDFDIVISKFLSDILDEIDEEIMKIPDYDFVIPY